MPAISDTSPLILLAKIGQFNLLRELYEEVIVPPAVFDEAVTANPHRTGAPEIQAAPWIRVRLVPDPAAVERFPALGRGEAEVIALGVSMRTIEAVILDDLPARRAAKQLRLPVVGSAGLMILAKQRGLIPRIAPLIDDLIDAGLRLSEHEATKLLALAGELPSTPHA